jgi:HEPN domain-containing protein
MAETGITNEEYANEWIQFAKMDIGSARHLLSFYPVPLEIICFHCQQCVEKCLKGFLILKGQKPPKTHDLLELCNLCEPFISNVDDILKQCNNLNKYSVQPRYPRELTITERDMKNALEYAEYVFNYFSKLMG